MEKCEYSLIINELLMSHQRLYSLEISKKWPFKSSSKISKNCKLYGLLPGIQSMHARFRLNRMLVSENFELIPEVVNFDDVEVKKELIDLGFRNSEASLFLDKMTTELNNNSREYKNIIDCLENCSGFLSLKRTDDNKLSLVYCPDKKIVNILKQIRKRHPVPKNRFFGTSISPFGSNEEVFTLDINIDRFNKLYTMYSKKDLKSIDDFLFESEVFDTHNDFLRILFCTIANYEILAGNSSGLQGALTTNVFNAIEKCYGIDQECFASPLNYHFPNYYSAFPIDKYFGSKGDFFKCFGPTEGKFEANPPFVVSIIDKMLECFKHALEKENSLLTFFIVVPSWKDAKFYNLLVKSPFLKYSGELLKGKHKYIEGMQHRLSQKTWTAKADSTWFLLCSKNVVVEDHTSYLQNVFNTD